MLPSLTYEVEHCSNSPENGLNYSASRDSEKSSSATPSEVYVPQIDPSLTCEVNHNADGTFAALPPSFASLLSNCYSQATQGSFRQPVIIQLAFRLISSEFLYDLSCVPAAKPAISVEDDLKSQIMVFSRSLYDIWSIFYDYLLWQYGPVITMEFLRTLLIMILLNKSVC